MLNEEEEEPLREQNARIKKDKENAAALIRGSQRQPKYIS